MHMQLMCAQCGKELGFSWQLENSNKQPKGHSRLQNACQFKVLLHLQPFYRSLKCEFGVPPLCCVRRLLGSRDLHNFLIQYLSMQ